MKANELRIGNLIYGIDRGTDIHIPITEPLKVLQIELFKSYVLPLGKNPATEARWNKINNVDISPIPLTEEWFLKFGAEKDKYGDLCIIDPTGINTAFYLVEGFIQWTKDCVSPIANFEHVKYVHQFQNLYFIKTDKELKMINTDE